MAAANGPVPSQARRCRLDDKEREHGNGGAEPLRRTGGRRRAVAGATAVAPGFPVALCCRGTAAQKGKYQALCTSDSSRD